MKILMNDTNITLQTDDAASSYLLLRKPDIADYGNVTVRPLVKSYHLIRETIWERFVQCVRHLEEQCRKDPRLGCYLMVFGALYTPLLSSSQAKNILCYGSGHAMPFIASLQDFMTFLQTDSSLVTLPDNPFLFSGFANGSWHAAVIDLDICRSLQTICDAMTKVRRGGTILLHTISDSSANDAAQLLANGTKMVFDSCTLYVFTMDQSLYERIYPYSAEAQVLMHTEDLLTQMDTLRALLQSMTEGVCSPKDCLYAIDLLRQAEETLFASYDYLEHPELPVYANALKEAVMDCSIGLQDKDAQGDNQLYLKDLRLAAQNFYTIIEEEFPMS